MNSPNNNNIQSSSSLKIICCLLILFFSSWNFAQGEIDPNGKNVFYHENGEIASEGMFKDGVPVGVWKSYYPSGQLKSIGRKVAGKSDSLWSFYSKDGLLTWTYQYENDLKNGCATKYDSLGNVEVETYYVNGVKQGEEQWLYPDGKVKKIITFVDDKEEGLAVEFDKEGHVLSEEEYRNGFLRSKESFNQYDDEGNKIGVWRTYHKNGNVATEISYKAGRKEGASKEFDKDGKLIDILLMKGDSVASDPGGVVMIDLYKEYHPNGKVKLMGGLNKGLRSGIFREYDLEGNMIKASVYIKDTLMSEGLMQPGGIFEGEWKTFYKNGAIKSQGPYENGKKNGKWVYYYPDGKKEQEGRFKDDVLIGQWFWYYHNGQVKKEEYFNRYGKLEGPMIEYDSLGNELASGEYFNGLREGDWFYQVGDFKEVGAFSLNEPDGPWKHYYLNGKIAFEGTFTEGEPKGKHIYYHKNGLRKLVGKYAGGQKHGIWRAYNNRGEQIEMIHYKHGEVFKINGFRVKEIDPEQ